MSPFGIKTPLRFLLNLHKRDSMTRLYNCPESGQPCLIPQETGIGALKPPPAFTSTNALE